MENGGHLQRGRAPCTSPRSPRGRLTRPPNRPRGRTLQPTATASRRKPSEGGGQVVDPNRLYFGDCLDVLREDLADASVDLIYLDPPFNSKRLYNAFIGDAQWVAFNDTWQWYEAVDDFHAVASQTGPLADTMEGLRRILGEGPNLAYLSYMAHRLRECWRVLKPTGSLYLHCDPTMSHYLKVVLDGLARNLRGGARNEIIWDYSFRLMHIPRFFNRKHDVILFYARDRENFFKMPTTPWTRDDLVKTRKQQIHVGKDGEEYIWMPGGKGRSKNKLRKITDLMADGKAISDVWRMPIISSSSKERIGYPTQKPLALLRRIIEASSPPGGVVLDPFCGCGTTIHAAQALGRRWVGIDVCVTACKVIEKRLRSHFDSLWDDVEFVGMPKTQDDARTLASMDAFRFERWAASLVDGMEYNKTQRGDKGIDGRGRIAIRKGQFVDIVAQVKGGSTGPGDVQAFNGARQQAGADLGIFTCFEDRVTSRMRDAAASTGQFMDVQRVQLYTVDDYFAGRQPVIPRAA